LLGLKPGGIGARRRKDGSMRFPKFLVTSLVFLLSFALPEVTFSINANAGMIPTGQVVADLNRQRNLETVDNFLKREEVQRELMKRGVAPWEARERIAGLSDFELQKLAGNIETAPAGADAVVVVSLTTLLIIIIIILLIRR
jgi:hypothetical protein